MTIGKPDFSDAQNSIKLDHLIVSNSGSGGAVQLNYVLNADIFVVADTAGDKGLALEQTQFSTIRGAMSAGRGAAVAIENGYSFANTLTSLDLEASPVCWLITSTKAHLLRERRAVHKLSYDCGDDPRRVELLGEHVARDLRYDWWRDGDRGQMARLKRASAASGQ